MKALTANRLYDGEAVFWKSGAWVERFAEALKANRHKGAAEIVDSVTQALTVFAAGSPAADDITLVVARRL